MDWLATGALELDARAERIRPHLLALELADAKTLVRPFAELLGLPIFALAADRVLAHLARAASPRRALLALQDCVQNMEASRGDASPLFVEPILALVVELAGASGRAARVLAADPALAVELAGRLAPEAHADAEPFERHMERILRRTAGDTVAFDRALRRFRNRQMLRLALWELRDTDVRLTAAEVADLASASLQAALQHHLAILEAQHGKVEPPCGCVVMGMGKLGGRELNYSSDIDVIYVYEHDQGRAGELSSHQFHVKLFERVTTSLAAITEHGMVFRVDLDLRPEGRPGPLANSLASAERYYETWGRTWERAAWIKARAVAGDAELGDRVVESMRPFVYRKSFDLEAIKGIVEMKASIDRAQRQAKFSALSKGLDLKLGKGGIREIEFFVQAHQLLHGGRNPQLRLTNTLETLATLEAAGLVNAKTREVLTDAYLFLRKVEHRIQIVEEQQTHTLPSDAQELKALARSLGFTTPAALKKALDGHMRQVHEHFSGLLGKVEEDEGPDPKAEQVANPELDPEARAALLAELGARAPESALANLDTALRFSGSPLHPHASPSDRAIGLAFLEECLASPSVDRALTHLPDLVRRLAIHRSYLSELKRPEVRRGIARVLGASDLLARILTSNPALLSQVLLAASLPVTDALKANLQSRLAQAGDDVELAMAILRIFKQEETLRTALADLAGQLQPEEAPARLTALAEVLVQANLQLAFDDITARFGVPEDPEAGLVVIAGGTLGAREMGYRSDVDLSFIYRGEGETTGGTRGPVGVSELYTRVVQRFVTFLTMRLPQGDLYPVDMRLRPSGSQGPLVATLRNFQDYHQRQAHLWERQALVRSRVIAGPPEVAAQVQAVLHHATYDGEWAPDTADRIHEMRLRMKRERISGKIKKGAGRFLDLKLGNGGLVEVEFLVQCLLLEHGKADPSLRQPCTRDALAALAEAGLFPPERAERLIRAQDFLRRLQNWVRLAHDEMLDHVDLEPSRLRTLALAVGYAGETAAELMRKDLLEDTAAIHEAYREVLGRGSGPNTRAR
ncbi:MAG: bifunctional [glutamate--ammonia ligase]-adenylyl-L-tyrosine phosphorylase/[glutamate--ammonia-ligase] adenylyltransferase [Myxococcales bacterium]|nr:bifunctional [glutamate--ammonia ligase]-adenylyl-L-tyrosine phosphorylase/[glutamate--ammonia-ligase] adenylyltransferase [Myxococcales bacterium]